MKSLAKLGIVWTTTPTSYECSAIVHPDSAFWLVRQCAVGVRWPTATPQPTRALYMRASVGWATGRPHRGGGRRRGRP